MPRINFHHLHYFWMVAKEGHLTRAAAKLHVSQSALSAQIRQLEAQAGQPLFVREGRRLILSEFGRMVMGYADAIFELGNELKAAMHSGDIQKSNQLKIGALSTLSRNFQENFIQPLIRNETTQLVLESGTLVDLIGRLLDHKLDLVLSNRYVGSDINPALQCRRISRQEVCLIGQPRDAQAAFRFPQDLHGQRLVLPGESSDIRHQFDVMCDDLGITYRIHAEVDDMAMLRLLARDSGCISVLPAVVVQDELRLNLLQTYCNLPGLYENFFAITSKRHFQSPLVKQLLSEQPELHKQGLDAAELASQDMQAFSADSADRR